ncbi:DUF1330 domain-containing protein [Brevibacterium aurantiacum]
MIAFPDARHAHDWWYSPAYQDIAPLRSRHIDSDIVIVEGVAEGYDSRDTA